MDQDYLDLLTEQNERIDRLETSNGDLVHTVRELMTIIGEQDRRLKLLNAWISERFAPEAEAVIARVDPKRKTAAQVIAEATGEPLSPSVATRLAVREFLEECETDTDRMLREIQSGKISANDWVPAGEGIG